MTIEGYSGEAIMNSLVRDIEDEADEIREHIAEFVLVSEQISYFDAWEMTRDDREAIINAVKRKQKAAKR